MVKKISTVTIIQSQYLQNKFEWLFYSGISIRGKWFHWWFCLRIACWLFFLYIFNWHSNIFKLDTWGPNFFHAWQTLRVYIYWHNAFKFLHVLSSVYTREWKPFFIIIPVQYQNLDLSRIYYQGPYHVCRNLKLYQPN